MSNESRYTLKDIAWIEISTDSGTYFYDVPNNVEWTTRNFSGGPSSRSVSIRVEGGLLRPGNPAPKPPSQEIYLYRRKGVEGWMTCDKLRFSELSGHPLFETRLAFETPAAALAAAAEIRPPQNEPDVSEVGSARIDMAFLFHPEPTAAAPKPQLVVPEKATPIMERAAEEYWRHGGHGFFSANPKTWAGLYEAMVEAHRKSTAGAAEWAVE